MSINPSEKPPPPPPSIEYRQRYRLSTLFPVFSTKTHKIARFAYVFNSGRADTISSTALNHCPRARARSVVRIKWHRSVAYEIRAVHHLPFDAPSPNPPACCVIYNSSSRLARPPFRQIHINCLYLAKSVIFAKFAVIYEQSCIMYLGR